MKSEDKIFYASQQFSMATKWWVIFDLATVMDDLKEHINFETSRGLAYERVHHSFLHLGFIVNNAAKAGWHPSGITSAIEEFEFRTKEAFFPQLEELHTQRINALLERLHSIVHTELNLK